MTIEWYDFVGTTGVVVILVTYFLLQTERLSSTDVIYSLLNLIGAALIAISLLFDFNLSAFIIEIAWMAISVYGIIRYARGKDETASG